jgi:hypothetical protein
LKKSLVVLNQASVITSWGAWTRTKIHRSKVWCAAIAPRPTDLTVSNRGILTQNE